MRHTSVRSAPRAQDRNGVRRRVFPALAIWAALCAGAQADDADLGRDVYGDFCVSCHGRDMVAYVVWLFALLHAADVARTLRGGGVLTSALALAAAVILQAALGIATLLHQAPLALALLHQAMIKVGFEPTGGSPQDFAALIAEQLQRWAPIVKSSGFQMD